ncbi:hypothetical protein QJS04_geneDACA022574 [Acorus gramineus]|uniref:Uncharacterized protein n=1 Tax=Acorus gramineus TaxID=55184 RepID=A0AAV9BDB0_ACOGR|nr:hypothetical protein QJS04_geneDACA022574 [Acorus gramineus]
MKALLGSSNRGPPFTINPYPYFVYQSDTRPKLAFCLQPNQGRFDARSLITYMKMFNTQIDAFRSVLNSKCTV